MLVLVRIGTCLFVALLQKEELALGVGEFSIVLKADDITSTIPFGIS